MEDDAGEHGGRTAAASTPGAGRAGGGTPDVALVRDQQAGPGVAGRAAKRSRGECGNRQPLEDDDKENAQTGGVGTQAEPPNGQLTSGAGAAARVAGAKAPSATYRLQGAVLHRGQTPFSGHYVAAVQCGLGWNLFNDEYVEPTSFDKVLLIALDAGMLLVPCGRGE